VLSGERLQVEASQCLAISGRGVAAIEDENGSGSGLHNLELLESATEAAVVGRGDLTVTSRRLIFRTKARAITCNLTSIIDITAYADGVAIQRTVGKATTYIQRVPDEDFGLILWRAWQEARASTSNPRITSREG
jgi:hypothetical protein